MKNLYTYCICRVTKYWHNINQDLAVRGYKNIKAYIPAVSVLRGSRNGKNTYENIPLLFNYGFIKMNTKKAYNRQYLRKLSREIPGIMSWVYSTETMHERKKRLRLDESEFFDDFSMVATVTKDQLKYYQRIAKKNQIFNSSDIVNLRVGDYITLKGYPFDGIGAKVEEINLSTKSIKTWLYPNNGNLLVTLPFDNVLYSIYSDFNEEKLQAVDNEYDINLITDNSVDELLDSK